MRSFCAESTSVETQPFPGKMISDAVEERLIMYECGHHSILVGEVITAVMDWPTC